MVKSSRKRLEAEPATAIKITKDIYLFWLNNVRELCTMHPQFGNYCDHKANPDNLETRHKKHCSAANCPILHGKWLVAKTIAEDSI